jgi:hypothetical protein
MAGDRTFPVGREDPASMIRIEFASADQRDEVG